MLSLSNTIHGVIQYTWPMILISVVIIVSFRVAYLIKNNEKVGLELTDFAIKSFNQDNNNTFYTYFMICIDRYLINEYKKNNPSKMFFRISNSMWRYYEYYLDSNYEAAKTICNERNDSLSPKLRLFKFRRLENNFNYAIACYANNEMELARKIFEEIVATAPKLYISNISKEYLEAIQNNSELKVNDEVLPESGFQLYTDYDKKKQLKNHILITFFTILLALFLVLSAMINYFKKQDEEQRIIKYEQKLNDAISENYSRAEFLTYFDVKYDDKNLDALCIIDTGINLDIASIITRDKGETSDLVILKRNLKVGKYYCEKLYINDYYIGFKIYDEKKNAKDFYHVVEFTYENTKYWFVIDYIGETPKK
mgnify:CR=1 FL=1